MALGTAIGTCEQENRHRNRYRTDGDGSSITSRWLKYNFSNKMNRHFIMSLQVRQEEQQPQPPMTDKTENWDTL